MMYFFDASELTPDSAKSIGIYRYAVGLARAMALGLKPDEQLIICCNGSNVADFQQVATSDRINLMCVQARMPGHAWRQWWMRVGCALMIRRLGADVYLSPKGFVPRSWLWPARVRRVAVIHDLIPFWYFKRHPGFFGRLETWLVGGAFRHTMAHADRIVAISSATHAALMAEHVSPSRVSVVLNGVDEVGSEDVEGALPSGVQTPFIFAMASGLPHKNLDGILAAYAVYRQQAGVEALPLVLCGVRDVVQQGVLPLGRVTDNELNALYRQARLFLFLSLIEGFGYPPIEALRVGTPVVCSDLGVLREVCGSLAEFAPPEQPALVGSCMFTALTSAWTQSNRQQLALDARRRIQDDLSWSRCAIGVLDVLRDSRRSA